jgi:FAD/FMN-containing dehydrogenase
MRGEPASPRSVDRGRRTFLQAAAGGACVAVAGGCSPASDAPPSVSDIAALEAMPVARIAQPASGDEVARSLQAWRGPVCIGGGRYSMGGQIVAGDALHLDMRGMNRLVKLDPQARVARVEAGMRWRELLEHLDPHDLSVAIMQSYSNFTVGGSVSVNCHGRYVGKGPLVNSIRALQLVTADGRVRELDRERDAALFSAVVGGYGGLGVVTEVELALDANTAMQRQVEFVPLADYPRFFRERVLGDPSMLMHNADLVPPAFDRPQSVSWRATAAAPTVAERLMPVDAGHGTTRAMIWAASELPGTGWMRERVQQEMLDAPQPVVWRNYEASWDVASLEPWTRRFSTWLLQEYFVPVDGFLAFAQGMAAILAAHEVNALNVSIRHSPADRASLMHWAADEVFCFVIYYKQRSDADADRKAERWTQRLVDLALSLRGRYYLPYRLHATRAQFRQAYPEYAQFVALKREIDPDGRFRNRLWDKYLAPA